MIPNKHTNACLLSLSREAAWHQGLAICCVLAVLEEKSCSSCDWALVERYTGILRFCRWAPGSISQVNGLSQTSQSQECFQKGDVPPTEVDLGIMGKFS